jgi:hypothetical protein
MRLFAWNMTDGTVHIHEARCGHRRPQKTGRPPLQQEQVEFGKVDWGSKESFCFDYWNNGILEEYEREHGEFSFDIWQNMEWKPCTDSLQDNEPLEVEPEPAKPRTKTKSTTPRVSGHRGYLTKPIPLDMMKYSRWLEENFSDTFPNGVDPRTVMIAVRTYKYFQPSDFNRQGRAAAK